MSVKKEEVKEGDYFILAVEVGYSPSQAKKAMQVMECWNKVMTVKCEGGCMSKPYSDFNKITDLRGKKVFKSSYFEDNRKTINKKNKLK